MSEDGGKTSYFVESPLVCGKKLREGTRILFEQMVVMLCMVKDNAKAMLYKHESRVWAGIIQRSEITQSVPTRWNRFGSCKIMRGSMHGLTRSQALSRIFCFDM